MLRAAAARARQSAARLLADERGDLSSFIAQGILALTALSPSRMANFPVVNPVTVCSTGLG